MSRELPENLRHLSPRRRGFTLVELLVVMAIIAIVIALVVPALGGSRNAARAAATQNLLKGVSTAVSVFGNDNAGAMPGPFTARQMGHSDNLTRGMSMSENVLLGLMGYQTNSSPGQNIQVGPSTGAVIDVDAQMIGVPGAQGKQYFTPDKKYWVSQFSDLGQQIGSAPHTAPEGQAQLPDLVDAWGTPILMWGQDETYVVKPSANNNNFTFARTDSGASGTNGAKFYWAQNACFLQATATGKKAQNQTDATSGSMLSVNNANTATSLAGLLGNPNAPWRNPQNLNGVPTVALSGRAPLIIQSAGIDGYYWGKKDKGAKQFPTGIVTYGTNFAPDPTQPISPTNQYLDKNNKPTNIDLMAGFDDLFSYAGS